MKNKQKFLLIQDDDGHWYLVPADKKGEFYEWMDLVYAEESYCGDMPEWVKEIDGPHSIVITSYEEV